MRVVVGLLLLAVIVRYFWWFVGVVLLWVLVWFMHDVAHQFVTRRAIEVAQRTALIARCDQQHAWVLAGDDRGTFGEQQENSAGGRHESVCG